MEHGPRSGLHWELARIAASGPERLALSQDGTTVTYAELDRRAAALARALAGRGVGPGDLVALASHRSIEAIVAMLAVLRLGAAYAPLDPNNPADRMRFVIEDCQPKATLAQAALSDALRAAGADPLTLETAAAAQASDGPMAEISPDAAAYMIYTSGTTGRPKGVLCTHRGVRNLVGSQTPFAAMKGAGALHVTALSFDGSVMEIWGCLLNGGRLIILPDPVPSLERIDRTIAQGAAWGLIPTGLFHLLVDHRIEALRPMRMAIVGGDVLSAAHAARVRAELPHVRLINAYGPTENAVASTMYDLVAEGWSGGVVPIGRAVPGVEVLLLNEAREPVADGEVGEIAVGGVGLALGYWRRPDLTAEKFVELAPAGGRRVYLTGDLGRRIASGAIEFHGRADRQVKIAGKRVELDEIEALLREDPAVADAVAALRDHGPGIKRLVAYIKLARPAADGAAALSEAVAARLARKAQPHMLPADYVVMEAFPLTSAGKVDRQALPPPPSAEEVVDPRAAGPIEDTLIDIWTRTLGLSAVGVDDNFFDLGGTSMMLVRAHAEIQARLAPQMPLAALLERPRIADVAAYLRGEQGAGPEAKTDAQRRAAQRRAALAQRRQGGPE